VLNDTSTVLSFLATRKSASAKALGEPGPSPAQLKEILEIGVRVPDHGKLTPWRFILFEGEGRVRAGRAFAERWKVLHPDHGEDMLAFQRGFFLRAPVVIGVVSRAAPHVKIPEFEQLLSSALVSYNIVLAATAMGFGAQLQTDWIAYDAEIGRILGLQPPERMTGFVYVGTPTVPLEDRPRPEVSGLVTRWSS
jgi:nitroreductase